MKAMKPFYYVGLIISMMFGVWHFFVPWLYEWYTYIPPYENLIVGIDYTNFFFSLLLSGVSLLLMILSKSFFNGNKETLIFYGFIVFVWFCRSVITFVEPWPIEPVAWAAYAQQIVSIALFIILLIPFISQLKKQRTE